MSRLLDGKMLAAEMRAQLKRKVETYNTEKGRNIGLAVVIVGNDPASQIYVRNKIKACEEVGFKSFAHYLPGDISQRRAEELVRSLAEDTAVDGILVQLPLPGHLNAQKLLGLIPAEKDVDGFSAENCGKLLLNEKGLVSCTPFGIMKLLEKYNIKIAGSNAVVLGRSNIVGKPMAMLLLNADATVTVCHSKTKNLKDVCSAADIIVSAVGKAGFVTADMVKDGAVVIDVGMNRTDKGLCGDVDFENVSKKCSYITPVPGGVGPMTITMLLYNTYLAAVDR